MNYLLHRHFGWRHIDVHYRIPGLVVYRPRDLRFDLRINPLAQSLSGHSLKPFIDFEEFEDRLVWYTILRDPVSRFISHYQHEVEKGGKSHDFHTWMRTFRRANWQVRMLAGEEDLEAAKQILASKFRCVGLLEHFNASLLLIRHRLGLKNFAVQYSRPRNPALKGDVRRRILEQLDQYFDEILENNELDLKLYEFVVKDVWPKQVEEYGIRKLQHDLQVEFSQRVSGCWERWRHWENLVYRNLVYKPLLWLDRKWCQHCGVGSIVLR